MAYSGNPADSDTDAVRFLIGDTGSSPDLSDNEIAYELSVRANVKLAASYCAERLAASHSKRVSHSTSGVSGQRNQLVTHYQDLAKRLRSEAYLGAGKGVVFGARTLTQKDDLDDDSTLVKPMFRRPSATSQEEDSCD